MFQKLTLYFMFASFLALTLGQIEPQPHPATGNTTTVAPTTPTTITTTLTPINTTTSASTTTSTTVVPTPSSTTPLPPAEIGKWMVGEANVTCILADLAIQVDVASEDDNKTRHSTFDVPANASSGGSCLNTTQELVLTWTSGEKTDQNMTLIFQFNKTESTKHFSLSHIILRVPVEEEKKSSVLELQSNVSMFSVPINKSYRCGKEQQVKLTEEGSNTTVATLKISNVQLEAFAKKKDVKFSTVEDCASSSSPDIVPIAVGCALVGLVAIVLIAYLLGRRRSQARGYLSM